METLTILVSVKNKEATIEKCLKSLLKLNYPKKKILVIDNQSTDRTPEILKSFGDSIEVQKKSGGLSEVFNWVLQKIKTKYFVLTDADCVVAKNWLIELMKPFSQEKDIVASAGYCGTPDDVSFFQKLIGLELENRFKKFPKYISRAPTMNLCLRTDIAKKVKFDESFVYQSFEVDFCYRLKKYGKIAYVPKAKIWHYHRSKPWTFFRQQKNQAKWGLKLFFKHGRQALADQITTFSMTCQIPLLGSGLVFYFLSILNNLFLYPSFFFLFFLGAIYLKNIIEINPPLSYYPVFFGLFLFRTFAWLIGIIEGFIYFIILAHLRK